MEQPDTAQMYRNEVEAGKALRESGLARSDVFITTKWSGLDGLDISAAIQSSLKNVCRNFLSQVRRAIRTYSRSWV